MYINERENGQQHLDMGEGDFLVWGGESAFFEELSPKVVSSNIIYLY